MLLVDNIILRVGVMSQTILPTQRYLDVDLEEFPLHLKVYRRHAQTADRGDGTQFSLIRINFVKAFNKIVVLRMEMLLTILL